MLRKLLYTFIALLAFTFAKAQDVQFSGTVKDGDSKPVVNASVYFLNTDYLRFTDSTGHFSFDKIKPGTYTIRITAEGYAAYSRNLNLSENRTFEVYLNDMFSQLDAVVISAQKREEALQLVPFSISSLNSNQVKNYRLWNARDIRTIIPNLYSSNPGDNRNVTSIRGIATTSYDPAVATYVDGVNQFNLDTYLSELLDIERIEVLRGPQGTLYGRNAMGGVINIITKQPSNRLEATAEINLGNYKRQRFTAAVRSPLVKNRLYAGAAFMYDGREGYYDNEFTQQSFDRIHSITGNYYLKYLPGTNWTITLNAKHHANRNNGTFPLIPGQEQAFENPFRLNQNAVTTMSDNIFNTSLVIDHKGSAFNFNSQTSFENNYRFYRQPIDGDFSPIDGITLINNYGKDWNNVKVFTQEFRFSSPAAYTGPWEWTAGAYFFHQNNPVKQATRFGEDAKLVGADTTNFSVINTSTGKGTGASVYGQLSYKILDKLVLTGGLRYDYEKRELAVKSEYQIDPNPSPIFDIIPDTSATVNFSAVSPKIGIQYLFDDQSQLYFNYARGYRAGGLTQVAADPSQPPLFPYDPEYSNNFELGIKNSFFGNRLRVNAALFWIQVNNAQVPTLVLPEAITVTRNAGKMESKGGELELSSTLLRSFQLDYNFGYTYAKYVDLKLSQGGAVVDLEGNRQIFTPDITSMLALQYNLAVAENTRVFLRGEWQYLGKHYFDLANSIVQDPYHLINARVGASFRNFELAVWGRNLTDKLYMDYAYDFGAVHLADPRTYGVSLGFRL